MFTSGNTSGQGNETDFYDLKVMASKSRQEFKREYKKYSEQNAKEFYLRVLNEIEISVVEGNINKLKRLKNIIDYISCIQNYQPTLTSFFTEGSNPLKNTNLVILACKHNQAGVLRSIFSSDYKLLKNLSIHSGRNLSPDDEDETCHNAFYYAIRSGIVELLYTLLDWPGKNNKKFFDTHLDDLDRILSTTYEELKLKNILLTDEIEFLVENKLVSLRFFSNNSGQDEITDLDNIKDRIELMLDKIKLLQRDYSHMEVDERFLFVAKFIAQNMQVLKRKLKSTYDKLPWEEMEFCLVCFVSSRIKQHEINLFCNALLPKEKLLYHLENFAKELKEVNINIIGAVNAGDLFQLPRLKREEIITNMISKNPQFKELFEIHEQIRDVYSLEKMCRYINFAASANTKEREGHFIIMRALQVIGEHLKHTLESPKLSRATSNLILLPLAKNTKDVIIELRNSLSHADSLFKRAELEKDSNTKFFIGIQSDIRRIGYIIFDILLNKKMQLIKNCLEKIVASDNFYEIKEISNFLGSAVFEKDAKKDFKTTPYQKLEKLINELSEAMSDKDNAEEELINRMIDIINFTNTKSKNSVNSVFWTSKHFNFTMQRNADANLIKTTKFIAEDTLMDMSKDPVIDSHSLKEIVDLALAILFSFKLKENPSNFDFLNPDKNDDEVSLLAFRIISIAAFATNDIQWMEDLKVKLHRKKSRRNRIDVDVMTAEKYTSLLKSRQFELKNILKHNSLDGGEIRKISMYKNDKKLQAVVEMLVLDILSILDILNNKLGKSYLFLDDDYPLLTGKCLRNHLAHDDVFVTLLTDSAIIVLLNARKLTKCNIIRSKKKIGKLVKDDLMKLSEKYKRNLEVIENKKKMFVALEKGNIERLNNYFRKGTDVNARNGNLWTALHFAAKGESLETLTFIHAQISNADVKDINGQTPLHIAATYGITGKVKYLIEEADLYADEEDNRQNLPLHFAVQNGHKNTVDFLLKYTSHAGIMYDFSPLECAIQNNHVEIVKLLLEENENFYTHESVSGFSPLHCAAENGALEIFCLLLKGNSNVDVKSDEGYSPLHRAALAGYSKVAEALILNGADINSRNKEGCTPLCSAVSGNHEEIVRILLKHGANVDAIHETHLHTPLHLASHAGFMIIAEILLEYYADINAVANEKTPIHLASLSGHLELVTRFLNHGANIHADTESEAMLTPLYCAAVGGHEEVAELLIKKGAEVDAEVFDRTTPLHVAALKGFKNIVELLLKNKSKVNVKDLTDSTPLHKAALNGHTEIVRSLIKNQANVNSKNILGATPLHLAVDAGHLEIVNTLIANGAYINIKRFEHYYFMLKNENLPTPLLSAIKHNHQEIIDILITKGADVNEEDGKPLLVAVIAGYRDTVNYLIDKNARIDVKYSKNATLLHFAAMKGHKEIVKILIENGANVDDITTENVTPLFFASKEGHTDVVEILLEQGADINSKQADDSTPLVMAITGGHEDIINILIEKGADVNIQSNKISISLYTTIDKYYGDVVSTLKKEANAINLKLDAIVTPLRVAEQTGHTNVAELISNTNIYTDIEKGPIEVAVTHGHYEVVKMLLQKNIVIINENINKWTAVHTAALRFNLKLLKTLTNSGYDINGSDPFGSKPMHLAASKGFKDGMEFFLAERCNVNDTDAFDRTALHCAVEKNNLEMTKFLINQNANINDKTVIGLSPLHIAALFGYRDVVKLLLKNGAAYDAAAMNNKKPVDIARDKIVRNLLESTSNFFTAIINNNMREILKPIYADIVVDVKNHNSEAPLHYAAWKGFYEVVNFLLENNANPNIVNNNNGFTPLHYAASFSHVRIVKALLSHGAIFNAVSHYGSTPRDLSKDEDISNLLNFVSELFEDVKNKNLEINNKLTNIRDKEIMRAVMCACNEDHKTFTVEGIQKSFLIVDVLENDLSACISESSICSDKGDYQKCLSILKRELEKRKRILGPNNPGNLKIERRIVSTLYHQGRYADALSVSEKICPTMENIMGTNHRYVFDIKFFIALNLHNLEKNEKAFDICQEIYSKQKSILGQTHEETLNTMYLKIAILNEQGKYEEALDIYDANFEKIKKTLGLEHSKVIEAQNHLATILSKQGKYEESLKIYQNVLDSKTGPFETVNSVTLRIRRNMAKIFQYQKKYSKALVTLQEILEAQKCVLGSSHHDVWDTQFCIILTLHKQGKEIAALRLCVKIFDQMKGILKYSHPTVVKTSEIIRQIKMNLRLSNLSERDILQRVVDDIKTAAKNGDIINVRRLIKYGVDVNYKDNDGRTSLHYATMNGHNNVVNKLLENEADVNEKDNDGRSPLHYATSNGHIDIVNMLVSNGANVNMRTNKGNTPLHIAVLKGNEELVEIFLKHVSREELGDFINAKTISSGNTALHVASQKGSLEILHILLRYGASYDIENNECKKPLDLSTNKTITAFLMLLEELFEDARRGDEGIVEKLRAVKTDNCLAVKNVRNKAKKTLIQVSIFNKHKDLAQKIIKIFHN